MLSYPPGAVGAMGAAGNFDNLFQVCTLTKAIAFDLTPSQSQTGETINHTTDNAGTAAWSGLAGGNFHLAEELPTGFDTPIVLCKIGAPGAAPAQQLTPTGDSPGIDFTLTAGETAECIWFNLPLAEQPPRPTQASQSEGEGQTNNGGAQTNGSGGQTGNVAPAPAPTSSIEPGGGSLTIFAYVCPEGYDVFANHADVAKDCPDVASQANFSITSTDGQSVKRKTGSEGSVVITNLKSKRHRIAGSLPPHDSRVHLGLHQRSPRFFEPAVRAAGLGWSGWDRAGDAAIRRATCLRVVHHPREN